MSERLASLLAIQVIDLLAEIEDGRCDARALTELLAALHNARMELLQRRGTLHVLLLVQG